jgi:hypothetical protein
MKPSTICHTAALIFGWFMIGVSVPHTLIGLNKLQNLLNAIALPEPNFELELVSIWVLAGIAMCLLGMWVLFNAREIKNLEKRAWVECYITSSVIFIFGAFFFIRNPNDLPHSLHMLGFALAGFILWLPLLLYRKSFE